MTTTDPAAPAAPTAPDAPIRSEVADELLDAVRNMRGYQVDCREIGYLVAPGVRNPRPVEVLRKVDVIALLERLTRQGSL